MVIVAAMQTKPSSRSFTHVEVLVSHIHVVEPFLIWPPRYEVVFAFQAKHVHVIWKICILNCMYMLVAVKKVSALPQCAINCNTKSYNVYIRSPTALKASVLLHLHTELAIPLTDPAKHIHCVHAIGSPIN